MRHRSLAGAIAAARTREPGRDWILGLVLAMTVIPVASASRSFLSRPAPRRLTRQLSSTRSRHTAKTKTTIRFAPDRPLPAALVRKLVKARIAENEQRTK